MSRADYTEQIGPDRSVLMCEICHATFHGDDDVTSCCGICGRCGMCEGCADDPEQHDCEGE